MKKGLALLTAAVMVASLFAGCGKSEPAATSSSSAEAASASSAASAGEKTDQEAADEVAALIDAIYVQEWTEETDAQCAAAKAAWDALTDAQKELVEEADYFSRDTGDAAADDPLNADDIGENELLVVSFGTSFNDSRTKDIGGIEKALEAAFPDWSVRQIGRAHV